MLLRSSAIVTLAIVSGFIALSLCFTNMTGDQLYENDICKLRDGSEGICTVDQKCLWFMSNVIRKKLITHQSVIRCGFKGSNVIVCCPKEQKEQLNDAGNQGSNLVSRVSARKAVQACQNFRSNTRLAYLIIEGEDVNDGEVPFIAALGYQSEQRGRLYDWGCGSSLISARFLLTAAHCIHAARRPVVARMGTLNLENSADPQAIQDTPLKNFYSHPDYTPRSKYNDIALIEVTIPFQYDDNVDRACLHTSQIDLPASHALIASGWGLTASDAFRSDRLLKVNLTTEPLDICDKRYKAQLGTMNDRLSQGIIKTQYCAIGERVEATGTRRDSCQGDSGGPLHYTNHKEERFYLVGVTSFGLGCGATASIYTRVASYLDWIEKIVWPDPASLTE